MRNGMMAGISCGVLLALPLGCGASQRGAAQTSGTRNTFDARSVDTGDEPQGPSEIPYELFNRHRAILSLLVGDQVFDENDGFEQVEKVLGSPSFVLNVGERNQLEHIRWWYGFEENGIRQIDLYRPGMDYVVAPDDAICIDFLDGKFEGYGVSTLKTCTAFP